MLKMIFLEYIIAEGTTNQSLIGYSEFDINDPKEIIYTSEKSTWSWRIRRF